MDYFDAPLIRCHYGAEFRARELTTRTSDYFSQLKSGPEWNEVERTFIRGVLKSDDHPYFVFVSPVAVLRGQKTIPERVFATGSKLALCICL